MARETIKKGLTSVIREFVFRDATGQPKTGIAYGSVTIKYTRAGDSSETTVTAVSGTLGTWTSAGWAEYSGTGKYQFGIPNAAVASGVDCVSITVAASGCITKEITIQLSAVDMQDAVRQGMTALPNAAASTVGGLPLAVDTSGRVDVLKISGTSQTARDIGASVLLSSGTGTGQVDITSGVVKSNLSQILGTALTETSGYLAAAFKKFFNVSPPTGTVNSLPAAAPGAQDGLLINGANTGTMTIGTLGISGPVTLSSTLSVTGLVTYGSLTVSGGTTLTGGMAANITGNLTGNIVGTLSTVTNLTNLPAITSGWLTAAGIASDAITAAKIADGAIDAATFASGALDAVWSTTTRVLTAGTNIALAKGTGVTGFNDITAASVAALILVTPANKLTTDASGYVTFANTSIATVTTLTNLPAAPTDWLSGDAVSAGAVTKIQSGLSTLSAAGVWSVLTSGIVTSGSIGELLKSMGIDFAQMVTGDGTASAKFTATALANAPTGGGGSGLDGPSSVTLTFKDADTNPVPLAEFTLLSEDKSTAIGTGRADSNGVATFGTDDGNYYVTTQATSTVLFADKPLTVSGTTAATITGSSNAPAGSADAGACTIYDTTRGTDDSIKDGVIYNIKIVGGPAGTQNGLEFSATSSGTSANNMSFTLGRGVQFVLKRGAWSAWSDPILVPDAASAQLASLLSGAIVGKDSAAP